VSPFKLKLHNSDVQKRTDRLLIPNAWQLDSGTQLLAELRDGATGILVVIKRIDPNTWHLRWVREGSPYDGRTFELARMLQTIAAPGRGDWECRLMLVEQESSSTT
jgi:hypothetical protein